MWSPIRLFSYLKDAEPPCYRSHRLGERAIWCVMEYVKSSNPLERLFSRFYSRGTSCIIGTTTSKVNTQKKPPLSSRRWRQSHSTKNRTMLLDLVCDNRHIRTSQPLRRDDVFDHLAYVFVVVGRLSLHAIHNHSFFADGIPKFCGHRLQD